MSFSYENTVMFTEFSVYQLYYWPSVPPLVAVQSTMSRTQKALAGVPTSRNDLVSRKLFPKSSTTRRE